MESGPDQRTASFIDQRLHELNRLLRSAELEPDEVDCVRSTLKELLGLIESKARISDRNDTGYLYVARPAGSPAEAEHSIKNHVRSSSGKIDNDDSRFMERVNHILRAPLNSIIGYAQLLELENERNSNSPLQKHTSEIINASQRLLQMVTDLMDLAKIENDVLAVSMEQVDVNELIERSLVKIRPLAKKHKVKIDYKPVRCSGMWVTADSRRLNHVFLRLFTNAIYFCGDNGRIEINCKKTWGNRLHVSLTDTGPGISDRGLKKIFSPMDIGYPDSYSADGLESGLALSRSIVELMRGRMGVESEPGKGSTFWIELEILDDHADVPESNTRFDETYGASVRSTLLYIEDSPTHMKLVEDIVETMPDIRFIGANSSMLGLELARTHRPDVILLDICLPDMDGCEFFEHLQKQKASRHIPVIVLSASASSEEIEKGLCLGFNRYLTKPIDIKEFKIAIKEVLSENDSR